MSKERGCEGFITVMFTAPTLDDARSISRILIEKKRAACANIVPVGSIYRWEGMVEETQEHMTILKARKEDFSEIEKLIVANHPYDVPCIVSYDILQGSAPYLDWIMTSTQR